MSDVVRTERNCFIELGFGREINRPWLENKAIEIEEYLDANMSDRVLGPSVTANFSNNSFDLHVTLNTVGAQDAQGIIGEILAVVERVADVTVGEDDREMEIRSDLRAEFECPRRSEVFA